MVASPYRGFTGTTDEHGGDTVSGIWLNCSDKTYYLDGSEQISISTDYGSGDAGIYYDHRIYWKIM